MDEMKDLVVVVTGSGKGLGKGIAESCYAEGATVVTWDRSGAAKAVADTLDPSGKRTLYVQADAVKEEQVVRAFDEVVKRFGRVDVLVNNAGISRHKPIEEMTLELFEEVMRINVTGLFLCCKAVVPIMKKQGRGKIVNISSLAARTGRPGVGVNYAASKGGVVALTQMLARELGPAGIYVNAIAPGSDADRADAAVSPRGVRQVECRSGGATRTGFRRMWATRSSSWRRSGRTGSRASRSTQRRDPDPLRQSSA